MPDKIVGSASTVRAKCEIVKTTLCDKAVFAVKLNGQTVKTSENYNYAWAEIMSYITEKTIGTEPKTFIVQNFEHYRQAFAEQLGEFEANKIFTELYNKFLAGIHEQARLHGLEE
ncbi:MAG: hypothetical protein MJ120_00095 [Clostridia bacterium]|nr:hypothetical protein [Clostridia bacterium]